MTPEGSDQIDDKGGVEWSGGKAMIVVQYVGRGLT